MYACSACDLNCVCVCVCVCVCLGLCVCVRGARAQQNVRILHLQETMEGWFIPPLRPASSLNINPAPSLTLRPVH